jgi:hypothetical protein
MRCVGAQGAIKILLAEGAEKRVDFTAPSCRIRRFEDG